MKRFQLLNLITILALALAMMSCRQKDRPGPIDQEIHQSSAQELALALALYSDAYQVLQDAQLDIDTSNITVPSLCADISHDSIAQTLAIDFGEGCVGPQGRTRSGLITVTYIGRDRTPGSEFSLTFDDYTVDTYGLSGELVLTNYYRDSDSLLSFDLEVIDGEVSWGSEFIRFETALKYTWVEGEGQTDPLAHVYAITGTSSGEDSDGRTLESQIVDPLLIRTACTQTSRAYPVEGGMEFTVTGFPNTFTLDFGDGDCDRLATLTYGFITIPLPLLN